MEHNGELLEGLLPDLVITNGNVITIDSNFSIAQAVAVKHGNILAVGTDDEITTFLYGRLESNST